MATTTNYGWTTPDDTALVKDGAAAIRTLGSSVDSTVFSNASAGIAKSIVDAKGDLIAATAADTVSRLAVGANNTVLTADSTTATGLKWATPASGGMTLLSTTTLTGASVTVSSISQAYNSLYIVLRNYLPATDDELMGMRFNADATASRHAALLTFGDSALTTFASNGVFITQRTDNVTSQVFATITIPDYTNTTTWKVGNLFSISNSSATVTEFRYKVANLAYNQTGAISSLLFFNNNGNFTSGTVLIYGVK
jgi:hypothetical protein